MMWRQPRSATPFHVSQRRIERSTELHSVACPAIPCVPSRPLRIRPWRLFLLVLSGLVICRQQQIIEFQDAQIRALMDRMGRKRILLTDDQRRVLAAEDKAIGRSALMLLTTGAGRNFGNGSRS